MSDRMVEIDASLQRIRTCFGQLLLPLTCFTFIILLRCIPYMEDGYASWPIYADL